MRTKVINKEDVSKSKLMAACRFSERQTKKTDVSDDSVGNGWADDEQVPSPGGRGKAS